MCCCGSLSRVVNTDSPVVAGSTIIGIDYTMTSPVTVLYGRVRLAVTPLARRHPALLRRPLVHVTLTCRQPSARGSGHPFAVAGAALRRAAGGAEEARTGVPAAAGSVTSYC